LLYGNGAAWAVGNGLVSSTLVIYLAMELGVAGLGFGVALIRAAPQLVGLLRLSAPAWIAKLGDRKRFCLAAYLASGLVLLGVPLVAVPGRLPSPAASLAAMIALWCLYHLLEYLATVALWSWLADLVPPRIRGRFLGRRQRWMVAGQAVAMLSAGLFTWARHTLHPDEPGWVAYAIPAVAGAGLLVASVALLMRIPAAGSGGTAPDRLTLGWLLAPLADARFRRLLWFGCWTSFFNGLTQSAQGTYPKRQLGLTLLAMLTMETLMRLGQLAVSPALGRLADRVGNRALMAITQPIVGLGLLFYAVATPEDPWWLVAAWAAWIAYAGLNIALPNLTLNLAAGGNTASYMAAYQAVTGLCVAASMLLGGWLADRLPEIWPLLFATPAGYYRFLFGFGSVARISAVLLLLGVVEPPRERMTHRG
jgi:hypothetical protein